jgi:hypothetical protein
VDLFRDIAPPHHWPLLIEHEGRTNERLVVEAGQFAEFIRPEDRVEQSSSHYITGPLTHPNPDGSRFSDGTFGVFYTAMEFDTVLAEVIAQREAFLRFTAEPPMRFDMRTVAFDLSGELHDVRGHSADDPTNVEEARRVAAELRAGGSYGLVFDSMRKPGGTCLAIFRPTVLTKPRQERHFAFVWDGERVSEVIEYAAATARSA